MKVRPPLDSFFRPAFLAHRVFEEAVRKSGQGVPLRFALERTGGNVTVHSTRTFPEGHPESETAFRHAERILKFLLWQRGGAKVYIVGPSSLVRRLRETYSPGGIRAFDADFMARVYETPSFEIVETDEKGFPKARESSAPVGGHLGGCRIGFDAGGSDRKSAAVMDGKEVFSHP